VTAGLLLLDKPIGPTSHDLVQRTRRLAGTRRVGHAGTLDPAASGLMILGVDGATRLLTYLVGLDKTYTATIRLGFGTTTDDAEGTPLADAVPVTDAVRTGIPDAVAALTGAIDQVPSSVSAVHVDGKRAHELVRAGETVDLPPRRVTIRRFDVLEVRGDALDVVVDCTSGTYIRALARDLGAALGTGGHLTALRRTAVGPYTLARAYTLKELEDQDQSSERVRLTPAAHGPSPEPSGAHGLSLTQGPRPAPAAADPWVIPLAEAAAAAFPRLDLTDDDALRLAQGARLPIPPGLPHRESTASDRADAPIAAFAPDGTLVALVAAEAGRLRSLAVFVDAAAKTRDT
jgi:tRNA pseudouridine55 synthase